MDLPLIPEMARDFAAALKDKKCEVDTKKVGFRNHNNIVFDAEAGRRPRDPGGRRVHRPTLGA